MTPRTTRRSPVLKEIWQQFATYDDNANRARRRFFNLRTWVLFLGVMVTILAVLQTPPEPLDAFLDLPGVAVVLRFLVVAAPVTIGILQSASNKFREGTNYVQLRGAAESLKREIFRYRMRVELYSRANTVHVPRDVKLVAKSKQIGADLLETETGRDRLQPYEGPLPPQGAIAEQDDGFTDLSPDEYIQWRVEDQRDYYRGRIDNWSKRARFAQWSIYIFSGLGTILAAFGGEIWVVVTTALVTAFISYQEYKRFNLLIRIYNQAAHDLDSVRLWWSALSAKAKKDPDNIDKLVHNTENILRTEHGDWMQEVREALMELRHEDEMARQTDEQ